MDGPSREYIPYHPPPPSAQADPQPLPMPAFLSQYSAQPGDLHRRMTNDPDGPDLSDWGLLANTVQNALRQETSVPATSDTPATPAMQHAGPSSSATLAPYPPPANTGKSWGPDWREIERPVPQVSTNKRWCPHCEIIKPDRTHHCRHCGTCVMQFDREPQSKKRGEN